MNSDVVIRAEGLGKKYVIGHESAERERYTALRDVIARGARNIARATVDMMRGRAIVVGDTTEEFWALKDINLEIKCGEVVGIIGRNGAGKSTLLKILSRITEPSEGQVKIKGRVASLLEVGTGFHPELTGRENIYLNGAILGMSRSEIRAKFDDIVAFAEITKFLDTPVKRYSSGMYVRLAFAVAAHLEPEILIVDEVLAVGDAEFQKKCLGKMSEVAGGGRTVLFVSHNMAAVKTLCSRAILLEGGMVRDTGAPVSVIDSYGRNNAYDARYVDLTNHPNRARNSKALLTHISLGKKHVMAFTGEPFSFRIGYDFGEPVRTPQFVARFISAESVLVFLLHSDYQANTIPSVLAGRGEVACNIRSLPLLPGTYSVSLRLWQPGQKLDDIERALSLRVEWLNGAAQSERWNRDMGLVYVDATWAVDNVIEESQGAVA